MFYTIYDVITFKMNEKGIEEKETNEILKKMGITAKQVGFLKSDCITLLPNAVIDNILAKLELSKLEVYLMLGQIPKEYEDSYLENIHSIAQKLTKKKERIDLRTKQAQFKTPYGELYNADCMEILPNIADESIDLIFADPPFNLTYCAISNKTFKNL